MSVTYKPIDWIDWLPPHLYRVGDDGSVSRWYPGKAGDKRRPPRWRERKPYLSRGIAITQVCHKGRIRTFSVAALVLTVFRGPCPEGHEATRKDSRDPYDNRLDNLAWVPRGFSRIGHEGYWKGKRPPATKLTGADIPRIFELRREGWTMHEIGCQYNVSTRTIANALERKTFHDIECDRTLPPASQWYPRGSRCGRSILAESDIPEIRRRYWQGGETMAEIATDKGVKPATISSIIRGERWGHVR